MNGSGRTDERGFTLIELMVVVAIVGILAAVAIPVFRGYILSSKASEAATTLQGIHTAEVAYFNGYEPRQYTANLPRMPVNNCDCGSETLHWNFPANSPWLALGFSPGAPTWYRYSVATSFNADGTSNGAAPPGNVGTAWPPVAERPNWFVVTACGDLDCDGLPTEFYISSHNNNAYHRDQGDEY